MRNFYMTANIDGRSTAVTGGPQRKDGGMVIEVRQRDKGNSVTRATAWVAFRVRCDEENGKLITKIINHKGSIVDAFVTER